MINIFYALVYTSLIFCGIKNVRSLSTVSILPSQCGLTAPRGSDTILKAHAGVEEGNDTYSEVISCPYTIQATTAAHRLRFSIGTGRSEVNVISHDMGCLGARMTVLDSDGATTLATYCGGVLDRTEYLSSADSLTLVIITVGGNSSILNFTAAYTSFTDSANCSEDTSLFPCSNGRCVSRDGQCDVTLINNCGDFSDNSRGPPGNCSSEEPPEPTTTVAITTATNPPVAEPAGSDLSWVPGIPLGLAGIYLLYWLLWRPGYLVWRCSCWRHLAGCKSCLAKQPSSSTLSGGLSGKDATAFSNAANGAAENGSNKIPPTKSEKLYESNTKNFVSNVSDSKSGPRPFELGHARVEPAPTPLFGIQREKHLF